MSMWRKKPRQNKSKEQIAFETKQVQEAQRKRKFVGEYLFPLLQKHSKNLHQAKQICKFLVNDINSTMMDRLKADTLDSLHLEKRVENDTDEASKVYLDMIEAFKDVPVGECLELLDGFPSALDAVIQLEDRTRTLHEFEWGDGQLKLIKKEHE